MKKLKNKKGISLIVLVITIIVMIILASAIILSLNGSNIIGKARYATNASDLANAKNVVALAKAEWELMNTESKNNWFYFSDYAISKLKDAGFSDDVISKINISENGAIEEYIDLDDLIVMEENKFWYKGTTAKADIIRIDMVDIASDAVINSATERWAAARDRDGDEQLDDDIMCYITEAESGKILTIAGNGSGKIIANPKSNSMFSGSSGDRFSNVTKITGTDILDVSYVEQMEAMFNYCEKLETVDVSNWDMKKVTKIRTMFQGCKALQSIDVSRWNTRNVISMAGTFNMCNNLEQIDVSNWNTSKVEDMQLLFGHCAVLKSLNLSRFDTQNVKNMAKMFNECFALKEIDLTSFDTSKVTDMTDMFVSMRALEKITLGSKFGFDGNGATASLTVLAVPDSTYIPDADGNWYDKDGNKISPANIPNRTAATYWAIKANVGK